MRIAASVDDRVVSNPDPEEQEPKRPKAKPIVSINGHDVDSGPPEEKRSRPDQERPAA